LTAIGGFARNVLLSLDEKDKNRRKLAIIVEETNRLENILSSLLEFSRPAVPRFTETDLNSLILQTIHFMDAEIDHALIRIALELEPNLPLATSDSDQMRQVLLNIFRNAIHAMQAKGGVITVRTRTLDSAIQIEIEDSGPGIPNEILDKIFDAFFTTKSTGSGLGLAICSQIIRNHNGRIEAFSPRGKGASFVITLPLSEKSP
jgi:signal transduction histidine kinase